MTKDYRALVMGLISTQLWLEVQDELKGTKIYRADLQDAHNRLEKKMEKMLGPEFSEIYKRDEESFRVLLDKLHDIAEWVATAKFEDVLDLSKALKNGEIKFED